MQKVKQTIICIFSGWATWYKPKTLHQALPQLNFLSVSPCKFTAFVFHCKYNPKECDIVTCMAIWFNGKQVQLVYITTPKFQSSLKPEKKNPHAPPNVCKIIQIQCDNYAHIWVLRSIYLEKNGNTMFLGILGTISIILYSV